MTRNLWGIATLVALVLALLGAGAVWAGDKPAKKKRYRSGGVSIMGRETAKAAETTPTAKTSDSADPNPGSSSPPASAIDAAAQVGAKNGAADPSKHSYKTPDGRDTGRAGFEKFKYSDQPLEAFMKK